MQIIAKKDSDNFVRLEKLEKTHKKFFVKIRVHGMAHIHMCI